MLLTKCNNNYCNVKKINLKIKINCYSINGKNVCNKNRTLCEGILEHEDDLMFVLDKTFDRIDNVDMLIMNLYIHQKP
jgi:hypothetical protein